MEDKNIVDFDMHAIGKRLRHIRKKLGLSLIQISKIVDFSYSMISDIETGKKKPSSLYLNSVITRFNINANYIFLGEGNIFRDQKKKSDLDKNMTEMFDMMVRSDYVKYSMLSHFISFVAQNRKLLQEIGENPN